MTGVSTGYYYECLDLPLHLVTCRKKFYFTFVVVIGECVLMR